MSNNAESLIENYITIENFMEKLKVSRTTVWRWRRRKRNPLAFQFVGGVLRISERKASAWLEQEGIEYDAKV